MTLRPSLLGRQVNTKLFKGFKVRCKKKLKIINVFPVPGGMTLREGISLVEKLGQLENLVSFDLVEVNPLIGTQDDVTRTVECARQIILNTFGYSRGGISGNFVLPKRA